MALAFNETVTVFRTAPDGKHVRFSLRVLALPDMVTAAVDADLEVGDIIERPLPNGKTVTMLLTKVDVLQSPFGSSALDHTEALCTTNPAEVAAARTAATPSTASGAGPSGEQVRQAKLLIWLSTQTSGFHTFESLYDGDEQTTIARRDVEALEHTGLLRSANSIGSTLDSIQAMLTPQGHRRAEELKGQLTDRREREATCRRQLLLWLYDQQAVDSAEHAVAVTGMLSSSRAVFVAETFTAAEIDRSGTWLARQGLIDGPRIEEAVAPTPAFLTESGVSCVEDFNGDVRAYRDQSSSTLPTGPTFHVTATNLQLATGDNANQMMTLNQVPEQMVNAINGLVDIVIALGYADGHDEELISARDDAIADVNNSSPDISRIRKFGQTIIGLARAGATPAITAAITAASDGVIHDAEELIRAIGR